jgi:hypothetical protein
MPSMCTPAMLTLPMPVLVPKARCIVSMTFSSSSTLPVRVAAGVGTDPELCERAAVLAACVERLKKPLAGVGVGGATMLNGDANGRREPPIARQLAVENDRSVSHAQERLLRHPVQIDVEACGG